MTGVVMMTVLVMLVVTVEGIVIFLVMALLVLKVYGVVWMSSSLVPKVMRDLLKNLLLEKPEEPLEGIRKYFR